MKHKTVPAPAIVPAKMAEIFARRYQELCKETGFQLVFFPTWVRSKETGDYRLAIQLSIEKMDKDASTEGN